MKFQTIPPDEVIEREELGSSGRPFAELSKLPDYSCDDGNSVLCELPDGCQPEMLVFQTSIVGPNYAERTNVNGFPVVWRTRFEGGVHIEVEAIAVDQP